MKLTAGIPFGAETFHPLRLLAFAGLGGAFSWGWHSIHQHQQKVVEAEAEARYASDRAAAAEKLRETTSRLKQSEQYFPTLVNTANEGIWVVEADGTSSYVNERMIRILDQNSVLGRPAEGFVHPEDRSVFLHQLKALRQGGVARFEVRIPRSDGSVIWLQVSAAPRMDGANVDGTFAMCTDITSRKQMEGKLLQLNSNLEQRVAERSAELSRLNADLESFCHSISHELRGPIARLNAFSGLVKEAVAGGDTEELPYLSDRIEVASRRLRTVIDSLLLINRLSRAHLSREAIDLSELASQIVNELCTELPGREVLLRVTPALTAQADQGMLNICLRNLLHNAVKYSGTRQTVTIEVGWQESSGAYYVRDGGVGFDMEFCHRLFEPFSRLHHDSQFEGSGMGLTIVKRIIERHGGSIWAEGAPGEGATFFFTLGTGDFVEWFGPRGGGDGQPVSFAG
ncbi:sensor histidine kinase [Geomonas limicola]|nr:ATP-binding protein [Geomonas limicola]